jgi:hypothetical protein
MKMVKSEMIYKLVDNVMDNINEDSNLGIARYAIKLWLNQWSNEALQTEMNDREIKNA